MVTNIALYSSKFQANVASGVLKDVNFLLPVVTTYLDVLLKKY